MARGLKPKDLEYIDELAAFYVKSKDSARLLDLMSTLTAVAGVPGVGAVMAKRVKNSKKRPNLNQLVASVSS